MVAHLLPPLPTETQHNNGENEDKRLSDTDIEGEGRFLGQAFAYRELEDFKRGSHLDVDSQYFRLQGELGLETCDDDLWKHIRRKPLPVDTLLLPLTGTSAATRDIDHRDDPHAIHGHNHLRSTVNSVDEHNAQKEGQEAWRTRQKSVHPILPPSPPHVRFASPLPYHPLPRTPSPPTPPSHHRPSLTRPTPHGARAPPWGSSDNLALDRRYRVDVRTYGDCLTERFELESRRLAQERQVAAEESRAGKRWTEVDELRALVREVYPDMEFEGNDRDRGWCCCCVVM